MAKILIKQNLEFKPLWHKQNLYKNNINLSLNKIRTSLYQLREEQFPDESFILNNISNIMIDLGENESSKNLLFPLSNFLLLIIINK